MEIRTYFGIITRYWWVIALVVVAATGTAAVLDAITTPVYNAHARVVVRPAQSITDERTLADILGQLGSLSLANTFAQTFTSAQVKADALKALNLSNSQVAAYTIAANRLPDTVVVEVRGSGPDPTLLANYINALVTAEINNSRGLFKVVELMPLEPASTPRQPTSPVPTRDIPTGAALGLAIGILLVLVIDYLRGAIIPATRLGIVGLTDTAGTSDADGKRPPHANGTQPVEVIEGSALISEDNQALETDATWLPAPRQRKSSAGRKRG